MRKARRVIGGVLRNRLLARVAGAYALFALTEYAVWIGVLVYAYDHGGATASGLVALAELLPAVMLAPLVATLADRHTPARLITAGYAVQGVATGALAVAVLTGAPPAIAYAAAAVASTAVSAIRPAQSAMVPALTLDVEQLTATNVLVGWLESLSLVLAGLVTGLALAAGSLAALFGGASALLLVAAALMLRLPVAGGAQPSRSPAVTEVLHGVRQIAGSGPTRVLVGLLSAEYVLIGALDVLFVVLAVDLLHRGQSWTGYLNTAYGVGGVVLGTFAALVVGRRLGPIIPASALIVGAALAATSLLRAPLVVMVLLGVAGGGRALFDVATRTLLQRSVPAETVARVFGVAEGLSMAGLAAGSLLTPILVAVGGARLAPIGVAAVLPLLVCLQARAILRLDQAAQVPIVEIALLRAVPLFRDLPGPSLEGVARALERLEVAAGTVVIRQGDIGKHYYAIAAGEVEIWRDGKRVQNLARGEGVGEIALLRGVPRTASVVTTTAATLYALDRDSFLTAVNGHVPTLARATGIARARDPGPEA